MKSVQKFATVLATGLSAVFLMATTARASNGTWMGAADAYWTNSQNWSASPYPSGSQTATFDNDGNGRTEVDVAGLSTLENITFSSALAAAYTIGAGGAGAQTLVMKNKSAIRLDADAVNGQVFNANIQLGADRTGTTNILQNDCTAQALTVAGDIVIPATGTISGYKTVYVNGAGETRLLGRFVKNDRVALLYVRGTGTLTLSGSNNITRLACEGAPQTRVDIGAGELTLENTGYLELSANQDAVIDGTGILRLGLRTADGLAWCYVLGGKTMTVNPPIRCLGGLNLAEPSGTGTLVLNGINEIASNIVFTGAGTISVSKIGNRGSSDSNLGQGERIVFNASGGKLLYTGTGETNDRILELNNSATLDHSGTGELVFSENPVVGGNVKTLTLQGSTAGAGAFAGAIGPGTDATSLLKAGTGTWSLSGANTYTGATAVENGTLALTGPAGSASFSSGYAVGSGAILLLSNTVDAKHDNRLGDGVPVSLNGGTLSFYHTGGAASYSEGCGTLAVGVGKNSVATSQADVGRTSTLTFDSLSHTAGTVDFAGAGLGESERNRIFITAQPDGLIGPWATVNGTHLAAYSDALGVYAAGDAVYTDFAARGPDADSVIPDDAAVFARINLPGSFGNMTLGGVWSNSVRMILQNTNIAATVATRADTTNKTLLTEGILIAPDAAALTIGESVGDGLLTALTPGGDLLLANSSSNVALTVNAAVTNNETASSLTKDGAGNVLLAGPVRHTGATSINAGTLTLGNASDQALPGVVSGAGSLAKEGAGTLRLSGNNAYGGETRIHEGTVVVEHNNALGPNGAGTTIAAGATLDVGGSMAKNALYLGAETITVSGDGVGGKGAVINSSAVDQSYALSYTKVSLAGNTTFGSDSRFGFWPGSLSPLLDLNGYTLSKVGSNMLSIAYVDVNPGAGNIDLRQGSIFLVYGTRLNGSAANTLTVSNDASLRIYMMFEPQSWTLALNNRSHVSVNSSRVPYNTWAGPVTLNGTAFLDGLNDAAMSLRISGPISGDGSLIKNDPVVFYLSHTNNTYTGTTIVSNGVLSVAHAGSLPGYASAGKVTVAPAGTLVAMSGDGTNGWSKSQLDALRTTTTFSSAAATLGLDTSLRDFVYDADISKAFSFAKYGANTLTLTGINAISGQVRVYEGALALGSAGTNAVGSVLVTGVQGTELHVDGPLTLTNYGSVTNGIASGDRCVMHITTNVTITGYRNSGTEGKFCVGSGVGASGAVIHDSGRVTASVGWKFTDHISIGNNGGYGYYRMNGGSLSSGQMGVTGGSYGSNVGVFELNDGAVTTDPSALYIGWTQGIAVMNLYGGSVDVLLNKINFFVSVNRGTFGMLNLLGPSATVNAAGTASLQTLDMATVGGNLAAVVNLNSGTLNVNRVFVTTTATPSFFNFNGGTLRAKAAQPLFMQGLTTATVYPGGAVIDSAGFNIAVNQSLLAPSGYGVTDIDLSAAGSGYIGAPAVQVSGGSGSNATAIAHVDLVEGSPTKGQVTGITVTSPGFGYQSSDVLTVTLHGGGYLSAATVGAVTKGVNTSGGLTKIGVGILTLGGTNTYAGATVISNGTLKLGSAGALPKDAPVVLAGGTLDLGGFTVTNTLGGTAGTVSNGTMQATISPAGAGAIGSETFTPGTATVRGTYLADVAAGGASDLFTIQGSYDLSMFELQLVNTAFLDRQRIYTLAKVTGTRSGTFKETNLNLPDRRWHVVYLDDGTVRLVFSNGTFLFLR